MPSAADLGQLPLLVPVSQFGAETPQAPPFQMAARHSSPAPAQKAPNGQVSQAQLQMQLQAQAHSQIQAYQNVNQAQAFAYALAQIQPQVQSALTKSKIQPQVQSQMQLGQMPAPNQGNQPASFAQFQPQVLQRQGTAPGSLLQRQRQASPPPRQHQSDEVVNPFIQMQRQLQEQVVAQAWAQAQVQHQRDGPMAGQQPQLLQLNRGRPQQTMVRQTSWAGTSPRPVPNGRGQGQPPPATIVQRSESRVDRGEAIQLQDGYTSARAWEPELQSAQAWEPVYGQSVQMSPSEAQLEADQELLPGIVVSIEGARFEIMQPLGMGSYGMVWSALSLSEDSREVAVKEILCRSQGELSIANFEGNLLQSLGQMEAGACRNGRLPALVAQETNQVKSDKTWRVRLAMSRIPGMPLMILLEQHREQKKLDPIANGSSPSDGQPFPERPMPRLAGETSMAAMLRKLGDPALYTRELIVQIFPTLERIAAVAFHRDINPRNILIDCMEKPAPPNYGLVDFGMAVDSGLWRANDRGNWNTLEVGGDCRYWPVSAWVMFLHGPQELTPGSPWRLEYQTQLDIHALGITALQVFVELLPIDCASANEDDGEGCLRAEDSLLERLKALTDAWTRYWEDAMDFWSCLIDCFTNNGDWNALKRACINHGVQEAITRDLSDLRVALAECGNAFELACAETVSTSDTATLEACRELQAVFRSMRELISVGDTTQFPNWRSLHSILGLPASMKDLAVVRIPAGSASAVRLGMGMVESLSANNVSQNKLSTSKSAPGRSNYNTITPATPGPLISRGVSRPSPSNGGLSVDVAGPMASPTTARRQASAIGSTREGSVPPNGSSTSRMISLVSAEQPPFHRPQGGSPMTSPRRMPQHLLADGRNTMMSYATAPLTGRRSGSNIAASAASPPGPSRALRRDQSLVTEDSMGQRSKSALVPANSPYSGQTEFHNAVNRFSSAAVGAQAGGVMRAPSLSLVNSGIHGSSSSAAIRASSVTNQDFVNSGRGGGMVQVMTKTSAPDFSPAQIIRGSSLVTSPALKRSHSPARGSSIILEAPSRGQSIVTGPGQSVVTSAANRGGASVMIEACAAHPSTARRGYGTDPSPAQGVRLLHPGVGLPSPPPMLSARQWGPQQGGSPLRQDLGAAFGLSIQGFAPSTDTFDKGTGKASGSSVVIGAAPPGYGNPWML